MAAKKKPAAEPARPRRPLVAVSMGDPAGVGPELCVRLLHEYESAFAQDSIPVVIGDARVLKRVAQAVEVPLRARRIEALTEDQEGPAILDLADALGGLDVAPGFNQAACGKAAGRYIEFAAQACLDGRAAAMVTCPISKRALNMGGYDFPGHTEMIAHFTGTSGQAMLLYSEPQRLAVAFATLHQALRSVPEALTVERIVRVATLLNQYLKLLHGDDEPPRIAVMGLNPHAGEEGLFGDEEETIVAPAVKRIRALGIDAEGPLPPDTAFTPAALDRFAGHVALYHDQGGIPFKMVAFDSGVNVTMGLELIRTCPDHGTAFDIAWKGSARTDSLFAAYRLAARLAVARRTGGSGQRISSRRFVKPTT